MTERPILFSGEMVRAILDGRKTQTRRVIKPQPYMHNGDLWWKDDNWLDAEHLYLGCPYGLVDDGLWMREGYQIRVIEFDVRRIVRGKYLADDARFSQVLTPSEWKKLNARKYRYRPTSGRFMYKSLSRCKLQITDVRVERVQDITAEDCKAEGVQLTISDLNTVHAYDKPKTFIWRFSQLWNSINYKRGFGWDVNPWVWAITFQAITQGGNR